MGDRWNIHNDAEQDRRYREETPLLARLWRDIWTGTLVLGVLVALFVVMIFAGW